ncbi:MAG: ribonuclease HII [Spirochaetia bacterium]|nr:ribonuclease HII [Spirochaetia bacterium]
MKNSAIREPSLEDKLKVLFSAHEHSDTWVIAMDEVGRGPLFGPVTVGGILFKAMDLFSGDLPKWCSQVNDSKKIKAPLRKELSELIKNQYIHHTSHVSVKFIDKYNINKAIQYGVYRTARALLKKAMAINKKLSVAYILLDGNYKFQFPQLRMIHPIPQIHSIIRGDEHLFHISCASILAKEERDRLIIQSAKRFSDYGLESNAGYGTLYHRNALLKHGVTPFHRKLFVKKILNV